MYIKTFKLSFISLICLINLSKSSENSPDDHEGNFPNCPVLEKEQERIPETLQSVQILNRHGMRTPIYDYPNDKYLYYDYGVQSGQLIPQGKYQSVLLGRCIRQRYNDFLGSTYSPKTLICHSSEYDRTIMTAELALAGLFPPTKNDANSQFSVPQLNWQPIPCNFDPEINKETQLIESCPIYGAAQTKFRASDSESLVFLAKFKSLYSQLTKNAGVLISDFDDVYHLYDTIRIQHELFNLDYPDWFLPLEPAMKENKDFSFYALSSTKFLQKLLIGPLLNEMVNNFNSITGEKNSDGSSGNLPAKMYLFSGHDTTVASLANALGIYDRNTTPYFNAAIFIELHKLNEKYWIKIFFKNGVNQPIVEKFMSGCSTPCSFQKFKESLKDILINDNEWTAICKSSDALGVNSNLAIPLPSIPSRFSIFNWLG